MEMYVLALGLVTGWIVPFLLFRRRRSNGFDQDSYNQGFAHGVELRNDYAGAVITKDDDGNMVAWWPNADPMRRQPAEKIQACKVCGAGTNEDCDAGLHS